MSDTSTLESCPFCGDPMEHWADSVHRANLAPAPRGTVKPLEWEEIHAARSDEDPRTEATGDYEAECVLGVYSITMGFGSDCYYWGVTDPNGESLGSDFEDPLYAKAAAQADYEARILAAVQVSPDPGWQTIETAPKDRDILVWYDHEADPYQDPGDPDRLTPYGTWAESGDFLDGKGVCIAKHHEPQWESVDEYGGGYYLPAAWFALENDDYARVVNPTHWTPLPAPPSEGVEP